jgi:hypothetical protein
VELAFAVGERDRVEVAGLAEGKPGREVADDLGGGVAGDVAADVVVDEGRGAGGRFFYCMWNLGTTSDSVHRRDRNPQAVLRIILLLR